MTISDWILVGSTLLGAILATTGVALLSRREPEIVGPEDDLPKTPIGRLRQVIEARDWERALPPILVMAGLVTLMLFGSLCLIVIRDQAYGGGTMLVVALAAIVKLYRDWKLGA